MTDEAAAYVINILMASYPGQAKKLEDETQKGESFVSVFKRTFEPFDDDLVADAAEDVINTSEWFPSIATIYNRLQTLRRERAMPQYQAQSDYCPKPREKIDMTVIRKALALIKDGTWEIQLSPELIDFSRSVFPDISEDLIRRNYCELSHAMRSSKEEKAEWNGITGTVVRPKEVLHMDKHGNIVAHVVLGK